MQGSRHHEEMNSAQIYPRKIAVHNLAVNTIASAQYPCAAREHPSQWVSRLDALFFVKTENEHVMSLCHSYRGDSRFLGNISHLPYFDSTTIRLLAD